MYLKQYGPRLITIQHTLAVAASLIFEGGSESVLVVMVPPVSDTCTDSRGRSHNVPRSEYTS